MHIMDNQLRNFRDTKILTLFYNQADTTRYMHTFKIINDQSSKSTWQHLLSHIVRANFTWRLGWPSVLPKWLYPEENRPFICLARGSFATWNKAPLKLGFYITASTRRMLLHSTQKQPTLLMPWSETSTHQSCEMTHFCCLSHSVFGLC